MKVIVYGNESAPRSVLNVQTAQVSTERELRGLASDLSGGPFAIIVLREGHEELALRAAQAARPRPKVVLARNGRLLEVIAPRQYRRYQMGS